MNGKPIATKVITIFGEFAAKTSEDSMMAITFTMVAKLEHWLIY